MEQRGRRKGYLIEGVFVDRKLCMCAFVVPVDNW